MANSSLTRIAVTLCLLLALAPFPCKASVSEPERARYEAAVAYCRSKPNQLSLNEDRSLFCFDGKVSAEQDVSSLGALDNGGLFVVRSPGGGSIAAARIATVLEEKQATVVVYDYCISACAVYFVVAPVRTYIRRNSIVAWHHGWSGWLACDPVETSGLDGWRRSTKRSCSELPQEDRQSLDELRSIAEPFFKRRVIDPQRHNLGSPPRSAHIARILRSKFEGTGHVPDVAWMWNPRYAKATLRTEVIYEAYPESQDDVDALTRRFYGRHVRSGHVLHDP
jgi:hypothetical protein